MYTNTSCLKEQISKLLLENRLKCPFNCCITDTHNVLKMMDGSVILCLPGVCWSSGIDTKRSDSIVFEYTMLVDKHIIHWFLPHGVIMELVFVFFIVVTLIARDSAGRGSDLS